MRGAVGRLFLKPTSGPEPYIRPVDLVVDYLPDDLQECELKGCEFEAEYVCGILQSNTHGPAYRGKALCSEHAYRFCQKHQLRFPPRKG